MECSKKDNCVNYKIRCFECGVMSDIHNHHPRYVSKEKNRNRLLELINEFPDLRPYAIEVVNYLIKNGVRVEE